jgi:hypothetical protein
MLQGSRKPDPDFAADESLYRRIRPDMYANGQIELDAVELPDMSVDRGKYAQPEWLLLGEHADWGVAGFRVKDIPARLVHLGTWAYTFEPRHVPHKRNYPHSEVWAFEDGAHIDGKERLDPILHLRWRHLLLRKIKVVIAPAAT